MTTSARTDLASADPIELTEYLQGLGWTGIRTELAGVDPDGGVVPGSALVVTCDDSARDLDADLDAYSPTALRGDWRASLPPSIRAHAGHLRDFEQAVRAGQPVTNAQTLHVIADIIGWIRLTEDRL